MRFESAISPTFLFNARGEFRELTFFAHECWVVSRHKKRHKSRFIIIHMCANQIPIVVWMNISTCNKRNVSSHKFPIHVCTFNLSITSLMHKWKIHNIQLGSTTDQIQKFSFWPQYAIIISHFSRYISWDKGKTRVNFKTIVIIIILFLQSSLKRARLS